MGLGCRPASAGAQLLAGHRRAAGSTACRADLGRRALLFGTSKHSRKALNLLRNAACGVHLESGDEVVILEGVAGPLVDAAALERFADRYQAKYDFRPQADHGESLTFCFRPSKGMGWREADFPLSATCWELD